MNYEQEKELYLTLIESGLTPEGAAGSIGNMYAESTLKSNIAQRGMTTLSDDQYTAAADNGTIDFVHDSVGYGLCQWTYYSRKAALLQFARERGCSVGDFRMQIQFYLQELKGYPGVLYILTNSHDLKQCSDIVCTDFERPAYNNLDARYQYSKEFYDKFHDLTATGTAMPTYTDPYIPDQQFTSPAQEALNAQNFFNNMLNNIASKISGKKTMSNAQMPVLKEGDQGAGVAAIQVALKYHKVDLGTVGTLGIWEAGTTQGVKTFQMNNGIPVTGEMDGDTWSKLMQ